ncbi:MAG: DUF2330 domain-containing protein, partial [Deltaproteobacteria bacterium]|nr:DUF2330 domain-containing protein [Deltaproteobacteria bacterium]
MGVGLAAAVPTTAHACGGTFCDGGGGGPQAMPVDQTGETIVFAIDDTHVEAHIQIEYDPTTNAERFAWLIPVMAQPEFSVGSQQLFLNLQNATVPSFGFINNFEPCGFPDDDFGGGGGGCGASTSGGGNAPGGGDEGGDDGGTSGGGVEVVQRDQVGAFDIVVV